MISKPVGASRALIKQNLYSLYTVVIGEDDLASMEDVRVTPTLFQELVPKDIELRVTIVRDDIFAVGIRSQHSRHGAIDWRRGYEDIEYEIESLPPDVADSCRQLLRRLGLTYGALDIIRTPDGRHVFLEINPNGEWGWIESRTGLQISEAFANALQYGQHQDPP